MTGSLRLLAATRTLPSRLQTIVALGPLFGPAVLAMSLALDVPVIWSCVAGILAGFVVAVTAAVLVNSALARAARLARTLETGVPGVRLRSAWDSLDALENGVDSLTSRINEDETALRTVVEFARRAGRARGEEWIPRALQDALSECMPGAEWHVVMMDQLATLPRELADLVGSAPRVRTGERDMPEPRLSDPGIERAPGRDDAWVVEFGGVVSRAVAIGRGVGDLRARRIAQLLIRVAQSAMRQNELASAASNNEKLAALGRLAAGVTHEINNALAALHTNLQLLVSVLTGVHREAASDALLGAERVERIVRDLASLSRGGTRLDAVERDLGAILLSAIKATAPRRPMVKIEAVEVRGVRIRCDPGRVEQVLVNLLANALDAASETEAAHVRVAFRMDHGLVHVDVHDSGRGIPADRQAQIFEPFFTTKGDGGTGLGLYISRTLARAHGGEITVRSSSAHGTTFTLTLPFTSVMDAPAFEGMPRAFTSERPRRRDSLVA